MRRRKRFPKHGSKLSTSHESRWKSNKTKRHVAVHSLSLPQPQSSIIYHRHPSSSSATSSMFSITNSSGWNGLLVLALLSPLTIWLFSALQFRYRRGGHPTPPGPTGLPLGGNIWALLRVQKQRETFGQYKRKFGKRYLIPRPKHSHQ